MADPDHIAIAKSGPNAISRWREMTFWVPNENPIVYSLNYSLGDRSTGETFEPEFVHGRAKLDLSGGYLSGVRLRRADLAHDDLSRADLTGCDFRQAVLSGANLQSAHMSRANLSYCDFSLASMTGCSLIRADLSRSTLQQAQMSGADLSFSNFHFANLQGANLAGANLSYADLSWTNLTGANLRGATLTGTTLTLADLTGADLRGATFTNVNLESAVLMNAAVGFTKIINCDLRQAIGLETARHTGPSTLGLDTIANSGGMIPEAFLRNAGVAAPLLAAQDVMRGIVRTFPSVLILCALEDYDLATRLKSRLAAAQIPAWIMAADDESAVLSGGTLIEHTPYYDSLALLCTESSLESPQASTYLAQVAGSQRQPGGQTAVALACCEAFYQREDHLCALLREGATLDFQGWEDSQVFEASVDGLVRLLSTRRI